jgi:ADP-ribosyl-[dinitrogen reductase] hydrolase
MEAVGQRFHQSVGDAPDSDADFERGRFRGALLGLAAGDALGTTLEFSAPGTFEPITDMVGGGPFGLAAGEWTDDTSMSLCLAGSLVERQGFDPQDKGSSRAQAWRSWFQVPLYGCDIGSPALALG